MRPRIADCDRQRRQQQRRPRNAASQRAGFPSVHHAKGASAAGAASTALAPSPGATAIAAAHTPAKADHAHFPRDSEWTAVFTGRLLPPRETRHAANPPAAPGNSSPA